MASVNKVFLLGNLTRDPDLRYTPSGTAVADLGLAVNRRYTSDGQLHEEVLFIGVVVWGKAAEAAAEYLSKGSLLHVEGRLQSRAWETKEGQKRVTVEVVADRVQFLDRKAAPEPASAAPQAQLATESAPANDEVPF